MINRKLFSIIAAFLVLASCFTLTAFADTEDTSVNEITPVAVWDMSNIGPFSANKQYIYDTNGENALNAYFGVTQSKSNNCVYSFDTISDVGKDYFFIDGGKNEAILNALDGAFTFSTWIKLDERFKDYCGNGTAIFWVANGQNENYPIQLSLNQSKDENDNFKGGKLILRRRFETSELYAEIAALIPLNEWTNIIISYDPASASNMPQVLVNGNVVSVSQSGSVPAPEGSAKVHTPNNDTFEMGRTYHGSYQFLKGCSMSKTGIYSGCITEGAAIETFNTEKPSFEDAYDVKFYDIGGALITNLNTVKECENTVKIDFSGADKATVTPENVYIVDKSTNLYVPYNASWENDTYAISGFTLSDGINYELIIKDIKNASGEFIKEGEFKLPFICSETSSLISLARYESPEISEGWTPQWGGYTTYVADTLPNSTYPKMQLDVVDARNKYNENVLNSYYTYNGNWTYFHIDSPELAAQLDSAVTYEIYVKIDRFSDDRSYHPFLSVPGIQMIFAFNDGSLYMDRSYDSGSLRYKAQGINLEAGKFYHIICTYEFSDKIVQPVFYVNGVRYETAATTLGTNPAQGSPKKAAAADDVKLTIMNDGGNQFTKSPCTWAMSSFYKGVADSYDAYKMYETAKAKFETYSVEFKDENNAVITADSIASANKAKASVTVTSKKTVPTVIMAVYNNGRLKDVKTGALTSEAKDAYVWETDFASIESGDTLKVMCWDSLGNMVPILSTEDTLTK